jgi:hypothetical protein
MKSSMKRRTHVAVNLGLRQRAVAAESDDKVGLRHTAHETV